MLFSVIVPIYKVEKYLRQCVDSILGQTYKDFELILVDDGSPDACPSICDEYARSDDRVVVIHQSNSGVVVARQAGVEKAKGDYLVFVDGDDWIDKNALLFISKHVGADIICYGYSRVYADKTIKYKLPLGAGLYSKQDIERDIFPILICPKNEGYFSPSICDKAFRRKLFNDNMMKDERLEIAEDVACIVPCIYNASSLCVMEECLYFYYNNNQSTTMSKKIFNWDNPEILAKHIMSKINIESYDFKQQLYRRIVRELFIVAVSQFNRSDTVKNIKDNIKHNLNRELYKTALRRAVFGGNGSAKIRIKHMILKYRLVFLLKYHSRKRWGGECDVV